MAAKIPNPRKKFHFNVLIPGLNPMLCQRARLPDIDYDIVEHGDAGFLVKTAGLQKLSTFQVDKLATADGPDEFIWDWVRSIRNTRTGGGAPPQVYKRNIIVEQYGSDNSTVVKVWVLEGAWPSKINGVELDRLASENTIESMEFSVDELN